MSPDSGRGEVVGKGFDIEDVHLGEDGSLRCLVTWKPSLIAMEKLVGQELRRRSKKLFGKRCSHQEVQRRTDRAANYEEMRICWLHPHPGPRSLNINLVLSMLRRVWSACCDCCDPE
jgi:hypothetical protein